MARMLKTSPTNLADGVRRSGIVSKTMKTFLISNLLAVLFVPAGGPAAEVCNLKVVTDASPDYSELPSLLHSVTAE